MDLQIMLAGRSERVPDIRSHLAVDQIWARGANGSV